MNRVPYAFGGALLLVALGCVIIPSKHEINARVVVEVHHIEVKAEEIVKFIEEETDELPSDEPAPDASDSSSSLLPRLWDVLSPVHVAYAAPLSVDSDRVRELAESMRERRPQIDQFKAKGYIGEDNRGYVSLREHEDLKEDEKKNSVQKVVAKENEDRKNMYKEIAQLNKIALAKVERAFANVYLKRAKPGEYYQLPPKGEDFDEFKKSDAGKKLGPDLKPGDWVRIPPAPGTPS